MKNLKTRGQEDSLASQRLRLDCRASLSAAVGSEGSAAGKPQPLPSREARGLTCRGSGAAVGTGRDTCRALPTPVSSSSRVQGLATFPHASRLAPLRPPYRGPPSRVVANAARSGSPSQVTSRKTCGGRRIKLHGRGRSRYTGDAMARANLFPPGEPPSASQSR